MDVLFYRILLYIHILSSIASIGPFFILFPIIKKLRTAKEIELSTLLDMFRSVVRLAKHAGHVLAISGAILIIIGPWTWRTPWIVLTLIILVCSLFFLARAFSPTLRKFQEENHDKEALATKLKRSTWIYIILLLTILWLMVAKPIF